MSIETRRTCVLSMARLTEATVNMIRNGARFFASPMSDDMVIAWVSDERGSQPDDLWACIEWAGRQEPLPTGPLDRGGFDYIMFDRDVDPADDGCNLPLYGEEVPGEVPSEGSILRKLIADAQRYYQKNIYQPEACPDGDMFNDLFALVEGAETDLNAL